MERGQRFEAAAAADDGAFNVHAQREERSSEKLLERVPINSALTANATLLFLVPRLSACFVIRWNVTAANALGKLLVAVKNRTGGRHARDLGKIYTRLIGYAFQPT